MKKILALLALVLGVVSCQTEPEGLDVNVGGEVETTICVTIPETETRAGGNNSAEGIFSNDLLTAEGNNLTMRYILQIFDANERPSDAVYVAYSDNKEVSFDVRLVPGRHYSFVVWADVVKEQGKVNGVYSAADDIHYKTNNGENGTINLRKITLNDTSWVAMDETRDAFTGVYNTAVEEDKTPYVGSKSINVVLKRPFAKLRVVTTDIVALTNLGITPDNAVVEYTTPYYTEFDAYAEEYVKGTSCKTHTYNIASYSQDNNDENMVLFTDYLFVNNDVVKFNMTVNEANGQPIKDNSFSTDINIRRNYLTTISGNILTDGNNVKVTVDEVFANAGNLEQDPYYYEIWDGKTLKEPSYDATTKTYTVKNGAELAWIAAAANGTLSRSNDVKTFNGETIVLANGIDLGGYAWTPISMSTDLANGKTFRGTFDGQGHTITGLYVKENAVAGLFGYVYAATIKNVTIEGANLNSNHFAGGIVAWVNNYKGNIQVPFVMENCHVKNSTITSTPELVNGEWDNGDKVGGLIGAAWFDQGAGLNEGTKVANCSVLGTTIKAYRDFGGLVGYAQGVNIKNCTADVTLEQDLTHDYKAPNTPTTFGRLIGNNAGRNTVDGTAYTYEAVADGVYLLNGNYHIYNAAGLEWLANEVNKHSNYEYPFKEKTIYLDTDIDLGGMEWTPIGDYRFSANRFCGTFDGQNHTISNFNITKKTDKNDSNKSSYGLFGNLEGTLKNLTVANATVNSYAYTGALVGRFNNGLIENCHVVNCQVSNTYWQGGILIGQVNGSEATTTIKDCTVSNSTITSKSAIGALAGPTTASDENKGKILKIAFENCRVENCQVIQQGSFGGNYDKYFGSMFGYTETDSNSSIDINNCTAVNTTVKGETNAPISGDIDGNITIDGVKYVTVSTAEALKAAVKTKSIITLGSDITMTESIAISNANFVLDGNGHTITMSEDATNTYALFDITGGKAAIKNITFDGIKSGAVVRTVGVEFDAENVTAQNGQHTQQQGLFRLMGKSTIKNSTFKNNTCSMVITLNYDGANNDPQVVENCVFEGNTCNATAVLYYVKGAGATINGNKFIGNTVNCSENGATVYMGFQENCIVKNNLFQNNTVNEAGTSSRVAGGIFFGYDMEFTGNAFVGNKVTGTNAKGNDVCVSTYYTNIDLSGNYWGGNAPVEDNNYFVQHKTSGYKVIINDFLTANPIQ